MTTTQKLESALKAYDQMFDNLDDLTHPAYMEKPELVDVLEAAVTSGKPVTQQEIEEKLGRVSWEW